MNYPTPYGNSDALALENLRLTRAVRSYKDREREVLALHYEVMVVSEETGICKTCRCPYPCRTREILKDVV